MESKKILGFSIAAIFLLSTLAMGFASTPVAAQDEEGELIKEINMEIRTKRSTGIGDTGEGTLNLFMQPVAGSQFEGISEEMSENLGRISSAGSYNNLYFNPAGEKYTTDVGGERQFNPYSIRKFRYAMNWIVDRQKIAEEMYGGYAEVRPTSLSAGAPNYDEYVQPLVDEHGITPTGNFEKAKTMIEDALTSAMEDPDLKGELRKNEVEDAPAGYWWEYKGPNQDEFSRVTVDVLIRIEDARQQIGEYYCDQLEKVGIDSNRNNWERSKAINTAWYTNPADQQWHVYTGGWGASGNSYFNRFSAFQMYAPFYAFMPGGFAGPDAWKYQHEELDKYGSAIADGRLESKDQYWEYFQKCIDMGLEESVRVFLTTTFDYYPYNDDSVTSYVPDAKIGWSSIWTANTMKTTDGVLDVAQYASQGSLFMDNWNFVAGASDTYSQRLLRLMRGNSNWMHPQNGRYTPLRGEWTNVEQDYSFNDDNELQTNLEVPDDAVYYDTEAKEWKPVPEDTTAATSATYDWKFSKFHDGHMMDDSDLVASYAWSKEWAYQDGEDDPKYQSSYSGQVKESYENIKGVVWHGDGKFTVYGDYTFPDESLIGMYYNIDVFKPWQVDYAAGELVASDEPSPVLEESYTWTQSEGSEWVHFISESQGQDFKAEMQNMVENNNIPPYLKEENNSPAPVSPEELESEVESINSFYDEYGHHYSSIGRFVLTEYDPDNKVMNFKRFDQVVDNPEYPFEWDHWSETLKVTNLQIGNIQVPTEANMGDEIEISISAQRVQSFPTEESEPAEEGDVTVQLVDNGDTIYETNAQVSEPGTFTASIPSSETEGLSEGSYELKVEGSLPEQEASAEESTTSIVMAKAEDGTDNGTDDGTDETTGEGMNTTLIAAVVIIILIIGGAYYYSKE